MSHSKPRLLAESVGKLVGGIILLKNLDIQLQTVFFEEGEDFFHLYSPAPSTPSSPLRQRPATIAEAVLEASQNADRMRNKNNRPSLRRVASDIRRQKRMDETASASAVTSPTAVAHAQSDTDLTRLTVNTGVPTLTVNDNTVTSGSPTSSIGSTLRRSPSRSNLMNKDVGPAKALAETGTSPATAFGRVETPFAKDHAQIAAKIIADTKAEQPPVYNFKAAHSYGMTSVA